MNANSPSPIPFSRVKVLAILDSHPATMTAALQGGGNQSNDDKLVTLTVLAGHVGAFLRDDAWRKHHLRNLYGFTAGWLMALHCTHPQDAISAERDRQDDLFRSGELLFNCSSVTASAPRKLRVLVEEIGEVAEAIDHLEQAEMSVGAGAVDFSTVVMASLRDELTQVAAVAVGWLESLEVKS